MNKHGSGTGTFDSEGRFRPQPLEDFFEKFDRDGKGGLTKGELWQGLRRSRMGFDFFGQVSAMFEWGFAWVLIWPEDGVLRKEDVRRLLDGSLYHEKVVNRAQREACQNGETKGKIDFVPSAAREKAKPH